MRANKRGGNRVRCCWLFSRYGEDLFFETKCGEDEGSPDRAVGGVEVKDHSRDKHCRLAFAEFSG